MYDSNLMFFDAATVTTTTSKTLAVNKTPARGIYAEVALTSLSGSTTGRTLDVVVSESDDDSTYTDLVTFAQITAVGRWNRLVQSQRKYLKLTVTAGTGTGLSGTFSGGLVTGPVPDEVA